MEDQRETSPKLPFIPERTKLRKQRHVENTRGSGSNASFDREREQQRHSHPKRTGPRYNSIREPPQLPTLSGRELTEQAAAPPANPAALVAPKGTAILLQARETQA